MEIWVHRNGQYAGRFSESVIREKLADGSLSATDLAWDEAKSAWKPISEFLAALTPAASPSESKLESSSGAAHTAAATEEPEPKRATPPPLPSMPKPAAFPPPLPTVVPVTTSAAQPAAHQPPEGETIWSPYMAIFGSILLTPAFGGFLIWRNWLRMNRRRRAVVAAPWFWLGFVVIALIFWFRSDKLVWIIAAAYLVAWIAFSAYPQIRYVNTTFKRERLRSGVPFAAVCFLFLAGSLTYWLTAPKALVTTPTLQPNPQQPVVVQQPQQQLSTSHDRIFTADELRDIYKSSVLEVRTTWKERRSGRSEERR